MRQPRILVLDVSGQAGLPYAKLVARLQPMELRVEPKLEKALASVARDSWDVGIVSLSAGEPAGQLVDQLRRADSQLALVVIDPAPTW